LSEGEDASRIRRDVTLIANAERVPRWYVVALVIQCCCVAIWLIAITHGSLLARCVVGYLGVLIASGLFLGLRRAFLRTLARPLPRRGPGLWLHVLPIRTMLAVQVLGALAAGLAIGLLFWRMFPDVRSGDVGFGFFEALLALNVVAASQVRRRRCEALSAHRVV
jgi:hypothetical protein